MNDFKQKVLKTVQSIPKGQTMTYAEVAAKAGSPKAARAVGSIMAQNQNKTIPCHRVIRSDGTIGPYNGLQGPSKLKLLQQEGAL